MKEGRDKAEEDESYSSGYMHVNDFAESLRWISFVVFLFHVIETSKWWSSIMIIMNLHRWVLDKRPKLSHATFKYLKQKHRKSFELQTFCIITQRADLHMHVTRAEQSIWSPSTWGHEFIRRRTFCSTLHTSEPHYEGSSHCQQEEKKQLK